MRLIKVKNVKEKVWDNILDLYIYSKIIKKTHYIVELNEDEYIRLIQKEKK